MTLDWWAGTIVDWKIICGPFNRKADCIAAVAEQLGPFRTSTRRGRGTYAMTFGGRARLGDPPVSVWVFNTRSDTLNLNMFDETETP